MEYQMEYLNNHLTYFVKNVCLFVFSFFSPDSKLTATFEEDDTDEVQGFLFGKLRWKYPSTFLSSIIFELALTEHFIHVVYLYIKRFLISVYLLVCSQNSLMAQIPQDDEDSPLRIVVHVKVIGVMQFVQIFYDMVLNARSSH